MVKGYAASEVALTYGRARELCQQIGEQLDLFPTLVGLSLYYLVRAELQTACELAEQCLRLAQHAQDTALLTTAYLTLGVTLFYQGKLAAAQEMLQQGSTFYDPLTHSALALRFGQDPAVACHGYASLTKWLLGYPDQALEKSDAALLQARQLAHSYSVGFALHTATWLHQYRQERYAVQAYAEEEIKLSTEDGFALWLEVGSIQRGWVLSEQGQEEQGLAQLREGLSAFSATGAELAQPYHRALLAQAYEKNGQPHEGLLLLDQALAAVNTTGECYYKAELYRLKGELTLQQLSVIGCRLSASNSQLSAPDPQGNAEAYFQKALAIARQQHAKSLELRSATSLARLWQQQDKVEEARALLEEVYNWFTEGFDTKDLQDAEALLVTLGGRVKTEDEKRTSRRQKEKGPIVQSSLLPVTHSISPLQSSTSDSLPLASNALYCEGDYWTLMFDGKGCRVRDMRGLHYIAYLLQHPHDEIHAFRLVSGDEENADTYPSGARLPTAEALSLNTSDSGEMLDAQARATYKQRLADLQADLDEAMAFHDQGRIDLLREELEFLTHELAQAVGLGGRARRIGSPAERARSTVTKAIKNALKKISEHHASLGQHLTRTIRTGTFCVYAPDPRVGVSWEF
jgi:predicted ATPase